MTLPEKLIEQGVEELVLGLGASPHSQVEAVLLSCRVDEMLRMMQEMADVIDWQSRNLVLPKVHHGGLPRRNPDGLLARYRTLLADVEGT